LPHPGRRLLTPFILPTLTSKELSRKGYRLLAVASREVPAKTAYGRDDDRDGGRWCWTTNWRIWARRRSAPSPHAADVGISVGNAVDVAKDAADIILAERRLDVLHRGIVEGGRASPMSSSTS
jgi:hypothetical protein